MKKTNRTLTLRHVFSIVLGLMLIAISANYLASHNPQSYADETVLLLNCTIAGIIYFLLRTQVLRPLLHIGKVAEKVAQGDHQQHVNYLKNNEIGKIATELNQLAEELYLAEQIIHDIEIGKFDKVTENESDYFLVKALRRTQRKLQAVAEEDRRREWVTHGLAQFGELIHRNGSDFQTLADTFLSQLIKYLRANQGGFFLLNDDNPDDAHLQLVSCYAYERKKHQQKRVEIGEGLLGQVCLEKDTVFLTDIPADYVNITSGLGKATPTCAVLVPLLANDRLEGVLELASFRAFEAHEIEFVEKIAETMATSVGTAQTAARTQRLLDETRLQTEALRAQEEEMRQNMEEMAATQEEMARMQHEVAQKEANLQAIINSTDDSITALDTQYRVIFMNEMLRRRYVNSQFNSFREGVNALDYLGSVRDEWKAHYDRALAGEKYEFTSKSVVAGEDCYRQYLLGPILNAENTVLGLYVFSRDITKQKTLEIEYEKLIQNSEFGIQNTD
ncbi:MAG: GAF domain-containing protein [Cytophagales bacterium]|nr:GAF domain-containing protein [Cytophagales bacterium]